MLNVYTPFRADLSKIEGGRALGAGIAQGGANLGNAMERMAEREKAMAAQAKKMRSMAKLLKDDLGLNDAEIEMADAQSLSGTIEGFMSKQLIDKHRKQQEVSNAQLAEMRGQREQETLAPQWAGQVHQMMSQPGPVRYSPHEAMLAASQSTGYRIPPTVMDDMVRSMARGGAGRMALPPGFENLVPSSFTQNGDGSPSVTYTRPPKAEDEKVEVGNYDWLMSDNMDAFKKGVASLPPKERDAALKVRAAFNSALGRSDPLAAILAALVPEKFPGGAAGGSGPDKIRNYNPKTHKIE
jgi:hypothetical protein